MAGKYNGFTWLHVTLIYHYEHGVLQAEVMDSLCSDTFAFILSLTMKLWHARQSPTFIALHAATTCSRMLSGGPTSGWRSLTRSTWWKFFEIIRRRASNSWAEAQINTLGSWSLCNCAREPSVSTRINNSKLRWPGRVLRTDNTRIPKHVKSDILPVASTRQDTQELDGKTPPVSEDLCEWDLNVISRDIGSLPNFWLSLLLSDCLSQNFEVSAQR